ncbi:Multidrug resistance protein MdtH [Streptomyces badius]
MPEADRVRDRKRERAPDDATRTAQPGRSSWQAVFANRAFLLLCLAYSSYLVAYNQLYLSLPVEVQRATGSQAALGWLFALSSLLVVAAQVPLTRWSARRIAPRTALVTGLAVVAAGFAAVPLTPGGPGGLLPGAALVVLLSLGQMLRPPARGLVPVLVEYRQVGLATVAFAAVSGLAVLADAMDEDLGVPQALAIIHTTVRQGNSALAADDKEAAAARFAEVRAMLGVLGLDPLDPQWAGEDDRGEDLHGVVDTLVRLVLDQRQSARARKDWAAADAIRDQLGQSGLVVEDSPTGPRWTLGPR